MLRREWPLITKTTPTSLYYWRMRAIPPVQSNPFLSNARTDLPSLMDQSESLFRAYNPPEHFAPFPLQIVVDQTGVIRYVSGQYDARSVREMIDSLLE